MNDTLAYIKQDPIYRRYHHRLLTFSLLYAFSENYILPFSHDEVVHMKGSMLGKVPGDDWQKAATLRALYGYMYAHPGKKLMFMGCEFGQGREWNYDRSLDWHLLDKPLHAGLQHVRARPEPRLRRGAGAAREWTSKSAGFQWIDCNDSDNSVVSMLRSRAGSRRLRRSASSTSRRVPRHGYMIGVPRARHATPSSSTATRPSTAAGNVGNGGLVVTEPVAVARLRQIAAPHAAAAGFPAAEAAAKR